MIRQSVFPTCLLVLYALAPGMSLHAQNGAWHPVGGPYGGIGISTAAAHPDGHLFITTKIGLFRSDDQGATWTHVDTDLDVTTIRTVHFDTLGTMYVGTTDGLYRSADSGATWSDLLLAGEAPTALAYNPNHNNDVYIGTEAGHVYRSEDQGQTWSDIAISDTISFPITALAKSDAGTLLASTYAGIFRTVSDGAVWSTATPGLTTLSINALFHASPVGFFAGSEDGKVFQSQNGGASWFTDQNWGTETSIASFYVQEDGTIHIRATEKVILLSKNGDLQAVFDFPETTITATLHTRNGSLLAMTGNLGLYRSTDSGLTWLPSNTGITSIITFIQVDPAGTLFVATEGGGVFRSYDKGATWDNVSEGLANLTITAMYIHGEGDIYVGTEGGFVYHSTDEGEHWTDLGYPGTSATAVIVNLIDEVFVGSHDGMRILRVGETDWVPSGVMGFPVNTFALDSTGLFFAGIPERIMRSPDHGFTWAATNFLYSAHAILTSEDHFVYAAATSDTLGIYRTFDDGDPNFSWDPINNGLAIKEGRAFTRMLDGTILLGTYGDGIYYFSKDDTTWSSIDNQLVDPYVLSMDVHPDGSLFAATQAKGIFMHDALIVHSEVPTAHPVVLHIANHPNPFSHSTILTYTLPAAQHVTVTVYDILGREMARLLDTFQPAGTHQVPFSTGGIASGVYFYRIQAGPYQGSGSMIRLQ